MKALKERTIGFRLDSLHVRLLEEAAKEYELSAGAYARRLVIEALEDTQRLRLRDEMEELRKEVARLRGDVALSVEALLVDAGKAKPEQAKAWVMEALRRERR